MAAITTTGTLTAGNSRTFALAPGSALTLTLLPNCRVTVTETPETVSASDAGGNSPRTHNHQLAGVVTYGPYAMGGSVVVDNASNSGSTVTWGRKDTVVTLNAAGTSLVSGDGTTLIPVVGGLSTTNSAAAATANTTVIQAALNAGGLVQILAPGTYFINGSLTIYDNTDFRLGAGVVIKALAGSAKKMLQTAAYLVTPTAVSLSWSSGPVLTITWTAHGVTTADYVVVEGVTQTQYNQVFKVRTVPDANTITVMMPRVPTASPTGTPVARKCTRNFTISGGTWDYNYSNNSSAAGLDRMISIIGFAAEFQISGAKFVGVYKYGINTGAAMNYSITDCYMDATDTGSSSELLKTYGPNRDGVVNGLRGRGTDDFASIQPREDNAFSAYRWTFGDIINFRGSNYSGNSSNGQAIVPIYCDDNYIATDIFLSNIDGANSAAHIFAVTKNQSGTLGLFGNIEVNGVTGVTSAANTYVCALGIAAISGDKLTVRQVGGRAVRNINAYSTLTCSTLNVHGVIQNCSTDTNEAVFINNCAIKKLTISDVLSTQAIGAGSGYAVTIAGGANIDDVDIYDCSVQGATGRRFLSVSVATCRRLRAHGNRLRSSGDSFVVLNQATSLNLHLDSNETDALAFVNATSAGAVISANVNATNNVTTANSNGFVRLTQTTNALTMTLRTAGNVITNAAHVTVVSGTPTISIYGWDLTVDPLALTGLATTAQQFLNSSRASAINQGPTVRTAAGWVALGTGASGVNTVIT